MPAERTSKNTSKRANPAGSATKDERKREVQGKIQKTTSKIESQRRDVDAKKRKLEEFSKSGIDGVAPEHKEEYQNVEEEFHNLGKTLTDYETELQELQKEEADIDAMDVDKNDGSQSLFVSTGEQSSSSNKPNGTPLINLTESNGKSKPLIIGGHSDDDDDDEEEAGFTPAQAREATGQSHGGKIVAWREQDRSKPVIVMYGPRNAAKYERSTAAREDNDFDEEKTAQFGPDHRLGDVKVNKKFVRRKRELVAILGLAYNCDLDDLIPKEKDDKRRLPPLEILVKWEIDGVVQKVWEIRSSIRHLFSNVKKADTYIYEAAKWHAARHQEWLDGKREEKDRSPTPMPNSRLSPTPEPKPIKTEGDDNNPAPPVLPTPPESPMLKYQKQWCERRGIDPKVMDEDPVLEARFMKAWNAINA